MYKVILLFFVLFIPLEMFAQIDTMALKTPEGVAEKMLEFISFEKDEVKDWDEFRNLFIPTAELMAIYPDAPPLNVR